MQVIIVVIMMILLMIMMFVFYDFYELQEVFKFTSVEKCFRFEGRKVDCEDLFLQNELNANRF